jgi:hypothetical protein
MNTHQHTAKPIVRITSEPQIIAADEPAFFVISVTENYKNIPLEEVHTMKMHLLLVNEELTWFDHIHPEETGGRNLLCFRNFSIFREISFVYGLQTH